jgi:hypothetical protein
MEKADLKQEKEKLEYKKLNAEEQQRVEAEWNTEKSHRVKHKHNEILLQELAECGGNPENMCSNVDVPENKSGTTYMYIEKGIQIDIIKLPVLG